MKNRGLISPSQAMIAACLLGILMSVLSGFMPASAQAKVTPTELSVNSNPGTTDYAVTSCNVPMAHTTPVLHTTPYEYTCGYHYHPSPNPGADMTSHAKLDPVFTNGSLDSIAFDTEIAAASDPGICFPKSGAADACLHFRAYAWSAMSTDFALDRPTAVRFDFTASEMNYVVAGIDAGTTTLCQLTDYSKPDSASANSPCPRTPVILPAGRYAIFVKVEATAEEFFMSELSPKPAPVMSASAWTKFRVWFGDGAKTGVSVADVSGKEGNTGNTSIRVPISLSSSPQTPVTVNWKTADDSATVLGRDYVRDSGTLTFNAGERVKSVTVKTVGDKTVEPDEQFRVVLTGATKGTSIADSAGTVGIENDEPAGCEYTDPIKIGMVQSQGCWKIVQTPAGTSYETTKPAWVGGLNLVPRSGSKLVLRPYTKISPLTSSGSVDFEVGGGYKIPIRLDKIDLFDTSFQVGLNTAGTLERLFDVPLLKGASAEVKVTWATGGTGATIEAQVALEDITDSLGEAYSSTSGSNIGTLSGKLTYQVNNGESPSITGAEIQTPEYGINQAGSKLKWTFESMKFVASVVDGDTEWSGEGGIGFPWVTKSGPKQASIRGKVYLRNMDVVGLGFGVKGFSFPIGQTGYLLTGVNGSVVVAPKFGFDVGIEAEHMLSLGGDSLLNLTGNARLLKLAEADCANGSNPFELEATANMPFLESNKLGKGTGKLIMCAYFQGATNFAFEASGSLSMDFDVPGSSTKKIASTKGTFSGWFKGAGTADSPGRVDFNLEGSSEVTLPLLGKNTARGLISSEGYAFCLNVGFVQAGVASHNWLTAPEPISGCDFSAYRVPMSSRRSGAIAAATTARTIQVPSGQTVYSLQLRGTGGTPRVKVESPDGKTYFTPTTNRAYIGSEAIILPDVNTKVTTIFLKAPAAGAWKLTPLAGNTVAFTVKTATQLPKPTLSAAVQQQPDGGIRLTWNAANLAGRKVEFFDRAGGVLTPVVDATEEAAGTVTFEPDSPTASARSIVARVVGDVPTPATRVASYTYALPDLPPAVTDLSLERSSRTLNINWNPAPRAERYLVTIMSGGGVSARAYVSDTNATFSPAPTGRFDVKVEPVDAFDRLGSAATSFVTS